VPAKGRSQTTRSRASRRDEQTRKLEARRAVDRFAAAESAPDAARRACPRRLPRRARCEDIVGRLHARVTRKPAFISVRGERVRLERAGGGIVVPLCKGPPLCIRILLRILLDESQRRERVRNFDEIRRHWIFLFDPLDLHNFGAVWKRLAIAG